MLSNLINVHSYISGQPATRTQAQGGARRAKVGRARAQPPVVQGREEAHVRHQGRGEEPGAGAAVRGPEEEGRPGQVHQEEEQAERCEGEKKNGADDLSYFFALGCAHYS